MGPNEIYEGILSTNYRAFKYYSLSIEVVGCLLSQVLLIGTAPSLPQWNGLGEGGHQVAVFEQPARVF